MRKRIAMLLCCVLLFSCSVPAFAASSDAQSAADTLYSLGLFGGTGVDADGNPVYSLDKPLNRQEAITLVLNLLGQAKTAQTANYAVPFIDVDDWAKPYVGYAYAKGITAGLDRLHFGSHGTVTSSQYLTFLLSCLGYDAEKDFSWDHATQLTDAIGVTCQDYADGRALTRGDAVLLSLRALKAKEKGSDLTLAQANLGYLVGNELTLPSVVSENAYVFRPDEVPAYAGRPYAVLNNNTPGFTASDLSYLSFERYSELDALGRCGEAFACLGPELMPTASRESIGQIRPSGWQTVRYDDLIPDKYLYNRCHLIGYQLTAENANPKNLITGTRYLNVEGMEPFESAVAAYIKRTGNHVLYRVTPVFEGSDLVAKGVHLEALSEEDGGRGIRYNLFFYNVQPGILIDYASGDSQRAPQEPQKTEEQTIQPAPDTRQPGAQAVNYRYIVNINPKSKKIHLPSCPSVTNMNESNKWYTDWTLEQLLEAGYSRCKNCNP